MKKFFYLTTIFLLSLILISCSDEEYEVSFDINGKISTIEIIGGNLIENIEVETIEGYRLLGWEENGDLIDLKSYKVNKDITLKAKFIEETNFLSVLNDAFVNDSRGWGFGIVTSGDSKVSNIVLFKDHTTGDFFYNNNIMFYDVNGNASQKEDDAQSINLKPYVFYTTNLDDTFLTFNFYDRNNGFFEKDVTFLLTSLDESNIKTNVKDLINNQLVNIKTLKVQDYYNNTYGGAAFRMGDIVVLSAGKNEYNFRLEIIQKEGFFRSHKAHFYFSIIVR
jgi:hypothetical protein